MAIENRGPELQAVGIAFLTFAYITVLLRSYVRVFIVKAFGLDDWLMVLALMCYTVHNIFMFFGIYYGTGRHFADLSPSGISNGLKFWYLDFLAYSATMMASKTSIAVFLLRITGTRRFHAWIIYISLGFSLITTLAFFFVCMFQCQPISYFWTRAGDGKCIDLSVIMSLTYTFSSFSMITDYVFSVLPIFMVWNLNMSTRSKWMLVPLFLMGTVASSAVAVRFAYVKTFKDPDYLWATVDIAIWSNVEMGLAIAAGSLATLRPLVRVVLKHIGLSSSGGRYRDYNTHSGSGTQSRTKTKTRTTRGNDLDPAELYNMDAMGRHKSHAWAAVQDPDVEGSSDLKVTTETHVTVSTASAIGRSGKRWKAREDRDNESEEGLRVDSHEDSKEQTPTVPMSFLQK